MSIANPVVASWNGVTRRIHLLPGVDTFHWMDDIYIEYRQARRLETDDIRKYNAFLIASGNESKGLGKATPRLVKLLEGTKVIFADEPGEKQVNGEAITDNADVDATLFDNSTLTSAIVINYEPPAAEVIVVDAIAKSLDYGGTLWYDESNTGTNRGVGQDHPIGTSANPVNNLTDGLVIALKFGLIDIKTLSNINLTQNISKFSISGTIPDVEFNTNGLRADLVSITNMDINGDFNHSHIHLDHCHILSALNVSGQIRNCTHAGRILISPNQQLTMADCESGIPGESSPEVDMCAGFDTLFSGRGISGGLTVTNCDTINSLSTIEFIAGKAHLEPSCVDGLISVRGVAFLDDRSNGTTIDTVALLDPSNIVGGGGADATTVATAVWEYEQANLSGSKTTMGYYLIKKVLSVAKFLGLKK